MLRSIPNVSAILSVFMITACMPLKSGSTAVTPGVAAPSAPAGPAASSSGTPQLPNILNSYVLRPSWNVAGVDYAVGPTSTPINDPQTINMAGVSIDTGSRTVTINNDNITLDGYDFSLHGGYQMVINGSNAVISNSNFKIGTNTGAYQIYIGSGANNVTINYNKFDGSDIGQNLSFIRANNSGVLTFNYNLMYNYGHIIEFTQGNGDPSFSVVYKYNLLQNGTYNRPGFHLNFLQFGGGTCTSADVEYNTTYQPVEVSGGEGFQFYMNTQGGLIQNGIMAYNTMIATGGSSGAAMSYMVHPNAYNNNSSAPAGNIHDNFFDLTAAWGAYYDAAPGWTYTNNHDMVNGDIVNSNNTESP